MTRAADLAKLIAGGGSITVSDNSENLKLVTTDADANVGPTLRMDRQSSSAADSDLLGKINFVGHNDAGTPEDIAYAGITAIISDASDGTEDGKLAINTIVAGTERSRIFVDADETVINEDGIDVDFRVESSGFANALFVEGSTGNVGIGTSSVNVSANDTTAFTTLSIVETVGNRSGILEIGDNQDQEGGGIGSINFVGHYQDANHKIMSQISSFSEGSTSGQRGSRITLRTKANGSTTSSEAMRIDSSQNVGIGTTSPSELLEVGGSTAGTAHKIKIDNEDNSNGASHSILFISTGGASGGDPMVNFNNRVSNFTMGMDNSDSDKFKISITQNELETDKRFEFRQTGTQDWRCADTSSPNLTLKNADSGADSIDFIQCKQNGNAIVFEVEGDGDVKNANNSYGSTSDEKLKENIADASSQWDDIKNVKVRKFSYKIDKESSANKIGVIAQELEKVSPNLVTDSIDRDSDTGEDLGTKTKSVKYSILYMKAVKALQEAMTRIETLEAKVKTLESK